MAHSCELVACAGFMRIMTGEFISKWAGRMINIHPSLLPLFKGVDTHERALEAGVRVHGCSVHFVSEELDAGAIIAQGVVPVLAGDDPDKLAARVLTVEHRLYPAVLECWRKSASRWWLDRPCSPMKRRHSCQSTASTEPAVTQPSIDWRHVIRHAGTLPVTPRKVSPCHSSCKSSVQPSVCPTPARSP
jgi:methionyl-tRNA formyltransferase